MTEDNTKTAVLSYGGGGTETIENVVSARTEWGDKTTVALEHPDGTETERTSAGVRLQSFQ